MGLRPRAAGSSSAKRSSRQAQIDLAGLFRVLLAAALLGVFGCARPAPLPDSLPSVPVPGSLYLADHRPILLADLASRARQADYILIGESHTNVCDHQFQSDVLVALARAGLEPGLGLEMVSWDRQGVLDEYFQGLIPLDQLEDRLAWQEYWGYSFDLYRPVLETAQSLGIPLVALNVPRGLQSLIKAGGLDAVPEDQRGLLPEEIILPSKDHLRVLKEEYRRHARMMQGHDQTRDFEWERFYLVQSLWDTQMAHRAAAWRRVSGRPMVILAGSGHVDYGYGIAHRLNILDHHPRILSVTPWRGGEIPPPDLADMYYYCPEEPQPRLGLSLAWDEGRAVIRAVLPDSRAEKAGLKAGDILLRAAGNPVVDPEDLHRAGKAAAQGDVPLQLEVLRKDAVIIVNVSPAR